MQVGVVFPQTEIGADPGAIRAYADAVRGLGYRHVLAYDHVLGADPKVHAGWKGPYDIDDTFHEPMVLFGYLAAFSDLELVSCLLYTSYWAPSARARSGFSPDAIWSMTWTSRPRWTPSSAASSPTGPAPVTTAVFGSQWARPPMRSTCSHALATTLVGSSSTPSSPREGSTFTAKSAVIR